MERQELYHKVTQWFEANMETAETELHYDSPFHLLIAVILSAQCTDKRVNIHTPLIFKRFPQPEDLAAAEFEEVYELLWLGWNLAAEVADELLCHPDQVLCLVVGE